MKRVLKQILEQIKKTQNWRPRTFEQQARADALLEMGLVVQLPFGQYVPLAALKHETDK